MDQHTSGGVFTFTIMKKEEKHVCKNFRRTGYFAGITSYMVSICSGCCTNLPTGGRSRISEIY